MQPSDNVSLNPFTLSLSALGSEKKGKREDDAPPAPSVAPKDLKPQRKKTSVDVAELQEQVNKMSSLMMTLLPYFKQKIEELDRKNKEQERQLNQFSTIMNNHLSQITTVSSAQSTAINAVLGQIQSDFQRVNEQIQENAKLQKEIQEQQALLLKISIKEGLKNGSVEIEPGDMEKRSAAW